MGSLYRQKYPHPEGDYISKNGRRYKVSPVWWCKYYRGGRPIRESTGTDKDKEAKRFLKLREGDVAQGRLIIPRVERIRFEDLAEDYLNDYRANGRRSLPKAKRNVRHLAKFFAGCRAVNISTANIRAFITRRQQDGASNASINRELTALRRMFNLALQAEKIRHKPHVPHLAEDNVRTGFFEEEAFRSLVKYLPEEVTPVATFAYHTGWRIPSEVLPLTWAQVDFRGGIVRLEPGTTKNREGRTFPMFPELRALLEAQRAYTESIQRERGCIIPCVFHRDGRPIRSFRRSWKTACRNAGQPGRIPHDFRRTAVRNMVRRGVSERVAMQLTGHKTRSIFDRYHIVSEGDLKEAGMKLTGMIPGIVGHIEAIKRNR